MKELKMPDYIKDQDLPKEVFGLIIETLLKNHAEDLTSFYNDLWWDTYWLRENLPTGKFFWGIAERGTGTHITTKADDLTRYCQVIYKFTWNKRTRILTMERVK